MDDQAEFKQAFEKAAELLGRRTHTSNEIRQKLSRRKVSSEIIERVVAKLIDFRFLNDEEAGRFYLESLIRYKTWGYYGLMQKLLLKGLEKNLVLRLLDELLSLETETAIARKALLKRGKQKNPRQAASVLQRKGFRTAVITRVVCEEGED